MRVVTSTLALCLLAAPALAQGYTEEQKAKIIAAFAANGCRMSESDAERLIPPTGIEKTVFTAVTSYLEDAGQASWSDETETMTLVPELCA